MDRWALALREHSQRPQKSSQLAGPCPPRAYSPWRAETDLRRVGCTNSSACRIRSIYREDRISAPVGYLVEARGDENAWDTSSEACIGSPFACRARRSGVQRVGAGSG